MTRRRSIETNNKIEKAVKLRAMGHTYEQIAAMCGYSGRQSAQKAVQNELKRRVSSNVDEMRTLQHLALEELWRLLWSRLYTKKGIVALRVVDRLLKVMDQEAKLYGLYMPRGQAAPTPQNTTKVIVVEVETEYQKHLN
jgi:hypothetical protein